MKVKEEVGLEGFSSRLSYLHVKVDRKFLWKLMQDVSGNEKPHCDKIFVGKLGLRFSSKYGCNTIYGWSHYNKTIPLGKLLKIVALAGEDFSLIYPKIIFLKAGQRGGEISPEFPIRLDGKLGSIIGHILGDGSIDLKYNQVFYSNSNKELLAEFERSMFDVFGVKPRIWMQRTSTFEGRTRWERRLNSIKELEDGKNGGLFYPTICGLILNSLFDNFALGKNKRITKKLLRTNDEFKLGMLRAFYDDEGTVDARGSHIRLFQDRKDILETFRKLLMEFEVNPGSIKSYVKRDKERYYFGIHRKSNFLKFQREIGFTSSKKRNRLRELCSRKKHWNDK
jgi:hypothetical protein